MKPPGLWLWPGHSHRSRKAVRGSPLCCGHCTVGWPQPSLRCLEERQEPHCPSTLHTLSPAGLGGCGPDLPQGDASSQPTPGSPGPNAEGKAHFLAGPLKPLPGCSGHVNAEPPPGPLPPTFCRSFWVQRKVCVQKKAKPHPRMVAGTGRNPAAGHWLRLRDVPVPWRPAHIPQDALHHPLNALAHAVAVETSSMRGGRPGARPQARPSLTL